MTPGERSVDRAEWPRFPDLRGPFVSGFCMGTDPDDETGQRGLNLTYDGVPIEIVPADFARELESERDQYRASRDELALMLGWALDWIETCCEVPLADEEPGPAEKWNRASRAMADHRAALLDREQ